MVMDRSKSPTKGPTPHNVRQPLVRERLHRVEAAADRLNLSPKTLRDWIANRKIGIVRLGRAVRVSESEIQRLIDVGTQPARRAAK